MSIALIAEIPGCTVIKPDRADEIME